MKLIVPKCGWTPPSYLDAILDVTELDIGRQLCTTSTQYVGGLSENERIESMVDRRSENS